MNLQSADDLRAQGFSGFILFARVRAMPSDIPSEPGIYAVVAPDGFRNDFFVVGTGGSFKGKNPNVPLPTLAASWVNSSSILYFGLAAAGATGRRGLRKRLMEYAAFGEGKSVGHQGGRYIWQLRHSDRLLVCWKATRDHPAAAEAALLRAFHDEHGTLPFANLRF